MTTVLIELVSTFVGEPLHAFWIFTVIVLFWLLSLQLWLRYTLTFLALTLWLHCSLPRRFLHLHIDLHNCLQFSLSLTLALYLKFLL